MKDDFREDGYNIHTELKIKAVTVYRYYDKI